MTKKHSFTWRKSIVFSATFLFIALVSVSCKKKENLIGTNTIDQNDLLSSNGQDTFQLVTYTFKEDSTITKDNVVSLLGSYNDPTFGPVNAEIFSQLHIQSLSPDFGDLTTVVVDSFVLGLVYSGFYGETGDQIIEVFEIDDADGISNEDDSLYYQFSTVSSDQATDWVDPNYSTVSMNPDDITIIDGVEVPSQLRIHLDTNRAKTFMQDAALLPTSFESIEAFSDYFKGLHIRTANGVQAQGEGGAFYFSLKAASSKMTIYYTQDGEAKTYDFYINGETPHFNHVDMDISMTRVQDVIDNPDQGQQEFYAQAFNTRAAIEMPTITDIPANAILHSAVMNLSVSHQTGVEFEPAGAMTVLREDPDSPGQYIALGNAVYSSVNKRYSFDLRFHVQRILNGELENTPLILAPLFFNSSADRIIFNGPETINKVKPSLRILYTEF
ncbi:MAG: DUF4270 family protein [Crocinitomicaceae bacterium]|nr:DUF4270 family protein [Crocinitomicaceae bacterium]